MWELKVTFEDLDGSKYMFRVYERKALFRKWEWMCKAKDYTTAFGFAFTKKGAEKRARRKLNKLNGNL